MRSEILPAGDAIVEGDGSRRTPYRVEVSDILAGTNLLRVREVDAAGRESDSTPTDTAASSSQLALDESGNVAFSSTTNDGAVGVYTLVFTLTDNSEAVLYVEAIDTSHARPATRLHSLDDFTGDNVVPVTDITAFIGGDEADRIVLASGNETIFSIVTVNGVARLMLTDDGRAELNQPFALPVALSVQATGDGPNGADKSTTVILTVAGVNVELTPVHAVTLDAPTVPLDPVSNRRLGVVRIVGADDSYQAALSPTTSSGFTLVLRGDNAYELRYTGPLFTGPDATALLQDSVVALSVGISDGVDGFGLPLSLGRSACYVAIPTTGDNIAVADLFADLSADGTMQWHKDGSFEQITGIGAGGFPTAAAGDAANGDIISVHDAALGADAAEFPGRPYRLYQNINDSTVRVKQLDALTCSSETGAAGTFIYLTADGAPTIDPTQSRLTYSVESLPALAASLRIAAGANAVRGAGTENNPYLIQSGFSGVFADVAAAGADLTYEVTNDEGYFSVDAAGALSFQVSGAPLTESALVHLTVRVDDTVVGTAPALLTAAVYVGVLNVSGVPTNLTILPGDFPVTLATLSPPFAGDTYSYTLPDDVNNFAIDENTGVLLLTAALNNGGTPRAGGFAVLYTEADGGSGRTRIDYELAACTAELRRPVFRAIVGLFPATFNGNPNLNHASDWRGLYNGEFHVLTGGAFVHAGDSGHTDAPGDIVVFNGNFVGLHQRDAAFRVFPDALFARIFTTSDGVYRVAERRRRNFLSGNFPESSDYYENFASHPFVSSCVPLFSNQSNVNEFFIDADGAATRQRQNAQDADALRVPVPVVAGVSAFDAVNDGASAATAHEFALNTFTHETVLVQLTARAGVAPYSYSTESADFAVDASGGGIRFRSADRIPNEATSLSATVVVADSGGDSVARVVHLSLFRQSLFVQHRPVLSAVGDGGDSDPYIFALGSFSEASRLAQVSFSGGSVRVTGERNDFVRADTASDVFAVDSNGAIRFADAANVAVAASAHTLTMTVFNTNNRTYLATVHLSFATVGGDFTPNVVATLTGAVLPPSDVTNLTLGTVYFTLGGKRLTSGISDNPFAVGLSPTTPAGFSVVVEADAPHRYEVRYTGTLFSAPDVVPATFLLQTVAVSVTVGVGSVGDGEFVKLPLVESACYRLVDANAQPLGAGRIGNPNTNSAHAFYLHHDGRYIRTIFDDFRPELNSSMQFVVDGAVRHVAGGDVLSIIGRDHTGEDRINALRSPANFYRVYVDGNSRIRLSSEDSRRIACAPTVGSSFEVPSFMNNAGRSTKILDGSRIRFAPAAVLNGVIVDGLTTVTVRTDWEGDGTADSPYQMENSTINTTLAMLGGRGLLTAGGDNADPPFLFELTGDAGGFGVDENGVLVIRGNLTPGVNILTPVITDRDGSISLTIHINVAETALSFARSEPAFLYQSLEEFNRTPALESLLGSIKPRDTVNDSITSLAVSQCSVIAPTTNVPDNICGSDSPFNAFVFTDTGPSWSRNAISALASFDVPFVVQLVATATGTSGSNPAEGLAGLALEVVDVDTAAVLTVTLTGAAGAPTAPLAINFPFNAARGGLRGSSDKAELSLNDNELLYGAPLVAGDLATAFATVAISRGETGGAQVVRPLSVTVSLQGCYRYFYKSLYNGSSGVVNLLRRGTHALFLHGDGAYLPFFGSDNDLAFATGGGTQLDARVLAGGDVLSVVPIVEGEASEAGVTVAANFRRIYGDVNEGVTVLRFAEEDATPPCLPADGTPPVQADPVGAGFYVDADGNEAATNPASAPVSRLAFSAPLTVGGIAALPAVPEISGQVSAHFFADIPEGRGPLRGSGTRRDPYKFLQEPEGVPTSQAAPSSKVRFRLLNTGNLQNTDSVVRVSVLQVQFISGGTIEDRPTVPAADDPDERLEFVLTDDCTDAAAAATDCEIAQNEFTRLDLGVYAVTFFTVDGNGVTTTVQMFVDVFPAKDFVTDDFVGEGSFEFPYLITGGRPTRAADIYMLASAGNSYSFTAGAPLFRRVGGSFFVNDAPSFRFDFAGNCGTARTVLCAFRTRLAGKPLENGLYSFKTGRGVIPALPSNAHPVAVAYFRVSGIVESVGFSAVPSILYRSLQDFRESATFRLANITANNGDIARVALLNCRTGVDAADPASRAIAAVVCGSESGISPNPLNSAFAVVGSGDAFRLERRATVNNGIAGAASPFIVTLTTAVDVVNNLGDTVLLTVVTTLEVVDVNPSPVLPVTLTGAAGSPDAPVSMPFSFTGVKSGLTVVSDNFNLVYAEGELRYSAPFTRSDLTGVFDTVEISRGESGAVSDLRVAVSLKPCYRTYQTVAGSALSALGGASEVSAITELSGANERNIFLHGDGGYLTFVGIENADLKFAGGRTLRAGDVLSIVPASVGSTGVATAANFYRVYEDADEAIRVVREAPSGGPSCTAADGALPADHFYLGDNWAQTSDATASRLAFPAPRIGGDVIGADTFADVDVLVSSTLPGSGAEADPYRVTLYDGTTPTFQLLNSSGRANDPADAANDNFRIESIFHRGVNEGDVFARTDDVEFAFTAACTDTETPCSIASNVTFLPLGTYIIAVSAVNADTSTTRVQMYVSVVDPEFASASANIQAVEQRTGNNVIPGAGSVADPYQIVPGHRGVFRLANTGATANTVDTTTVTTAGVVTTVTSTVTNFRLERIQYRAVGAAGAAGFEDRDTSHTPDGRLEFLLFNCTDGTGEDTRCTVTPNGHGSASLELGTYIFIVFFTDNSGTERYLRVFVLVTPTPRHKLFAQISLYAVDGATGGGLSGDDPLTFVGTAANRAANYARVSVSGGTTPYTYEILPGGSDVLVLDDDNNIRFADTASFGERLGLHGITVIVTDRLLESRELPFFVSVALAPQLLSATPDLAGNGTENNPFRLIRRAGDSVNSLRFNLLNTRDRTVDFGLESVMFRAAGATDFVATVGFQLDAAGCGDGVLAGLQDCSLAVANPADLPSGQYIAPVVITYPSTTVTASVYLDILAASAFVGASGNILSALPGSGADAAPWQLTLYTPTDPLVISVTSSDLTLYLPAAPLAFDSSDAASEGDFRIEEIRYKANRAGAVFETRVGDADEFVLTDGCRDSAASDTPCSIAPSATALPSLGDYSIVAADLRGAAKRVQFYVKVVNPPFEAADSHIQTALVNAGTATIPGDGSRRDPYQIRRDANFRFRFTDTGGQRNTATALPNRIESISYRRDAGAAFEYRDARHTNDNRAEFILNSCNDSTTQGAGNTRCAIARNGRNSTLLSFGDYVIVFFVTTNNGATRYVQVHVNVNDNPATILKADVNVADDGDGGGLSADDPYTLFATAANKNANYASIATRDGAVPYTYETVGSGLLEADSSGNIAFNDFVAEDLRIGAHGVTVIVTDGSSPPRTARVTLFVNLPLSLNAVPNLAGDGAADAPFQMSNGEDVDFGVFFTDTQDAALVFGIEGIQFRADGEDNFVARSGGFRLDADNCGTTRGPADCSLRVNPDTLPAGAYIVAVAVENSAGPVLTVSIYADVAESIFSDVTEHVGSSLDGSGTRTDPYQHVLYSGGAPLELLNSGQLVDLGGDNTDFRLVSVSHRGDDEGDVFVDRAAENPFVFTGLCSDTSAATNCTITAVDFPRLGTYILHVRTGGFRITETTDVQIYLSVVNPPFASASRNIQSAVDSKMTVVNGRIQVTLTPGDGSMGDPYQIIERSIGRFWLIGTEEVDTRGNGIVRIERIQYRANAQAEFEDRDSGNTNDDRSEFVIVGCNDNAGEETRCAAARNGGTDLTLGDYVIVFFVTDADGNNPKYIQAHVNVNANPKPILKANIQLGFVNAPRSGRGLVSTDPFTFLATEANKNEDYASIQVRGGTAPYSYAIKPGGSSLLAVRSPASGAFIDFADSTADDLRIGEHGITVVVTDSDSATREVTLFINAQLPITTEPLFPGDGSEAVPYRMNKETDGNFGVVFENTQDAALQFSIESIGFRAEGEDDFVARPGGFQLSAADCGSTLSETDCSLNANPSTLPVGRYVIAVVLTNSGGPLLTLSIYVDVAVQPSFSEAAAAQPSVVYQSLADFKRNPFGEPRLSDLTTGEAILFTDSLSLLECSVTPANQFSKICGSAPNFFDGVFRAGKKFGSGPLAGTFGVDRRGFGAAASALTFPFIAELGVMATGTNEGATESAVLSVTVEVVEISAFTVTAASPGEAGAPLAVGKLSFKAGARKEGLTVVSNNPDVRWNAADNKLFYTGATTPDLLENTVATLAISRGETGGPTAVRPIYVTATLQGGCYRYFYKSLFDASSSAADLASAGTHDLYLHRNGNYFPFERVDGGNVVFDAGIFIDAVPDPILAAGDVISVAPKNGNLASIRSSANFRRIYDDNGTLRLATEDATRPCLPAGGTPPTDSSSSGAGFYLTDDWGTTTDTEQSRFDFSAPVRNAIHLRPHLGRITVAVLAYTGIGLIGDPFLFTGSSFQMRYQDRNSRDQGSRDNRLTYFPPVVTYRAPGATTFVALTNDTRIEFSQAGCATSTTRCSVNPLESKPFPADGLYRIEVRIEFSEGRITRTLGTSVFYMKNRP